MTLNMIARPRCDHCGGASYHDHDYYENVMRCVNCARVVVDLTPTPAPTPPLPELTPAEDMVLTKLMEYGEQVTSNRMAQLVGRNTDYVAKLLRSLTEKGLLIAERKNDGSRRWYEWRVRR